MMGGGGGEAFSLSLSLPVCVCVTVYVEGVGRLGGGVVFVCLEKVVQQRACLSRMHAWCFGGGVVLFG